LYIDSYVYAFVFRIDRKKDKTERKILDSQERAFWDVHRPVVKLFLNDETFQVLTGEVLILVNTVPHIA